MPNIRRKTTSRFRRQQLAQEIGLFGIPAMRLCQSCIKSGVECKVGSSADACMRCTSKNVECDLVPFSPAKWRRLQQARAKKAEQLEEALARVNRLHKEIRQLEKKSVQMVENEVASIEEQEQEEALPDLSSFPIDVSSEQVEFPPNLDWSPFAVGPLSSVETAAEGPDSSQGS